jgi:hypothetical protein
MIVITPVGLYDLKNSKFINQEIEDGVIEYEIKNDYQEGSKPNGYGRRPTKRLTKILYQTLKPISEVEVE